MIRPRRGVSRPEAEDASDMTPPEINIRGLDSSKAWDYENGFYWFSDPARINKLLAHYELYKSITSIPGSVFELGVYKAASLLRLATFRNLLETEGSRSIVGFDAFGDFPTQRLALEGDLDFIKRFEGAGGPGLSIEETEHLSERKGFRNVNLVKGNIFETLPTYLERHPHTRLAFLHLDMDVREPTEFALDLLYDRIVPHGLIVVDDYNGVVGATDVIDQFAGKHGLRLEKLSHYSAPTFIRKPL